MASLSIILWFLGLRPVQDQAFSAQDFNAQYYRLDKLGMASFKAEGYCNLIEQMLPILEPSLGADSKAFKQIADLHVSIDYKDTHLHTKVSRVDPFPNEIQNRGMDQMKTGIKQIFDGFFQMWLPFVMEELIPSGVPIEMGKEGGNDTLTFLDQGIETKVVLNGEGQITRIYTSEPSLGKSVSQPIFKNANGLLILDKLHVEINETITIDMELEYNLHDGMLFPSQVKYKNKLPGNSQDFIIMFSKVEIGK